MIGKNSDGRNSPTLLLTQPVEWEMSTSQGAVVVLWALKSGIALALYHMQSVIYQSMSSTALKGEMSSRHMLF